MYYRNRDSQKFIERLQKSIDRLDTEMAASRQQLSHDITIDNRTFRDLNLVIKVHDEDQNQTLNKSESRVHIPHQSTFRHQISTTPRERLHSQYLHSDLVPKNQRYFKHTKTSDFDENNNSKYQYQTCTPKSNTNSIKVQRKFQPFNRINHQQLNYRSINTKEPNKHHHHLTESGIQTDYHPYTGRIPQSRTSERIGDEGSINYLPTNLNPSNNTGNKFLEHTDPINLPILLSQANKNQRNECNKFYGSKSPQNINYLKQQRAFQPSTPRQKTEQRQATNFTPAIKESNPTRREEKDRKVDPLSVGYQNIKKYFQEVKEREMLNKLRKKEELKKPRAKESPSKQRWKGTSAYPKSNEKYQFLGQFELSTSRKEKANDLFLERKTLFMKNLEKNQEEAKRTHRSRSNSHQLSSNNFTTPFKKPQHSQETSDKVKDVSERLYSRSKEKQHPCNYHQRFGESIERERFYYIVGQNSFVQKYVSKQEQEQLFQVLRREDEAVQSWPMKILNYTYSKLQKINSAKKRNE